MSENLIFLYEQFDYDGKLLKILKDPSNQIFALDYHSHKHLENLELKYEILDKCLVDSDLEKINEIILDISTKWYISPEIKEELVYDGINLGWLLEQELHGSLIQTFLIYFSLIKISKKFKPKSIFVSHSIFNMISSIFQETKIYSIPDKNSSKQNWANDYFSIKYNLGLIPITIRIPRSLFFKIRKFYEYFFIPFFNKFFTNFKNYNNSIILVDFNSTQYKEFFQKLSEKKLKVFLLNRRRAAIWNFESFKIIRKNNFRLISFEKYVTKTVKIQIKNDISEINKKLEKVFSNKLLFRKIFSVGDFELWTHLSKSFEIFCKLRFEEAIYEIIVSKIMLSEIKPSLILNFYDVALQEKTLIHNTTNLNFDSILLQHGTPHLSFPGFSKMNQIHGTLPLKNDKKIALWGPIMYEYAIKNGIKKKNILESGSPRHDSFFQIKNNEKIIDGHILIAIGQIDKKNSGSQLTNVYINYEQAIKTICNSLKKITNIKKIVKLHPGDMVWKSVNVIPIIKNIDPEIQILVDGDLTNLINNSSVVITVGVSTVLLEANILQKPTLTLLFDPQEYLSALSSGFTTYFYPNQTDEFENLFLEILNDQKISNNLIENGNEFVKKYLYNHGNASDFLSKEIEKLII